MSESDGTFAMEEISDVTETESLGTMDDFDKLKEKTRKLKIIETEETETCKSTREECADEFLRNFFIKFGMKKTLDIFDSEWFEKKANGDVPKHPPNPKFKEIIENLALTDQIATF